jgi:hypothetical protein
MSELKLRNILGDVKSKNPEKRFRALQRLYELDQNLDAGKQISMYLLTDVIKTAAHPFEEPVDDWDQPSFYLLEFVSDYKDISLAKAMFKYYEKFSPAGKHIVLNYICGFQEDFCHQAILKIYEEELKTGEAIFPINGLFEQPVWLADIITRFSDELLTDKYRNRFYQALYYCVDNGYLNDFQMAIITDMLIADYKRELENIKDYLDSYSTRSVYMSWRDNYLRLRHKLSLHLSLMEYYGNDETKVIIKDALSLKDPTLQVKAIRIALLQNITVDEGLLQYCAEHIETSELLYHELMEIGKDSVYPIKEKKQHYFAKSHLFQHLLYELDYEDFPADIQIIDNVETENYYGQPIRFYLVSFSANHDDYFVAWVGAYSLEAGDDNVYMWEGTYTDFARLDDYSVEEHIQHFMEKRKQRTANNENEVHLEQKPRFSAGLQGYCAIVILQWIGALASHKNIIVLLPFTILALILVGLKLIDRKNVLVKIEGHTLSYKTSRKNNEILLHEIERLKMSRRKIEVYSRQNNLAFTIKKKHVDDKTLIGIIQGLTGHLKEPPRVE